ncbi:MAG: 50S ribosomal protein L29 [Candidatus Yonathbacteria bacterium RIFCSPHIGHO2_01_FULL_44_41]|uniref:Large ribosomal subunit protein uL29 n=1 Tax=Candidatus Yonathbacteria bacterium RIFCSPHIGHO2_02_FULL_44_14 TaxID=1802724 RepID=A0A1G2S662_9BACT|nr:MAG: 50S ribosomal protein L29 [Candidatus Yonathbacteria bacterium RIFCSPHIGHO2_01_FULL_44_41]OHA80585.1 MAG: 50S ribosomal protein L29 [Candidatus Yonathbacteria bacterium RIFCSPHIGHO2_02_FULL_44_14]OHA82123.1 MAG: 50S ribosomal protein L29 [Candidatus Yonathbacteria bacterium RIFCSPLOWO2_01_FULL_43_20]
MKEIKKKSVDDLVKLLSEKREAVRAFRFDIAGSAKKNVKASMLARKEIARILTEQNMRNRNVIA